MNNKKEQVLTVGLLKELIGDRNIPQLIRIIENRNDDEFVDLFDRDAYIATKLWSKEDVAEVIENEGFEVTDELIEEVLMCRELRSLGDCTEHEWDIIRNAVKGVINKNLFE